MKIQVLLFWDNFWGPNRPGYQRKLVDPPTSRRHSKASVVCRAILIPHSTSMISGGDWSLYGRQRLWGSIGYGLSSIVVGSIIDAISSSAGVKNYKPAFYFSFIVLIIDVVTSYFFIKVCSYIKLTHYNTVAR